MKNIILINLLILSLGFTACDKISEIENKSIVTACIAIKDDNTKYGFYISVPSGAEGGQEEGSKSGAKYYEFEADNFNSALMKFKESVSDDVDISHMNLFAGNDKYYEDKFEYDEKYISRRISVSSLVDVCMIKCTEYEFIDCIDSEYDSKASDLAESILTEFEMNLSKLSLSIHNRNYTARIPVIRLRERGKAKLLEVYTMSYYNPDNGYTLISQKEFDIIKSKKAYSDKDICQTEAKSDVLRVKTDNKELASLGEKYALLNTDIFNIRYHLKKEFLYYDSYLDYIKKHDLENVEFVGDSA